MLGHWEILLIFLVVLLFFGGRKIPEIARGLGKGMREFKKAKDEIADSLDEIDSSSVELESEDKNLAQGLERADSAGKGDHNADH